MVYRKNIGIISLFMFCVFVSCKPNKAVFTYETVKALPIVEYQNIKTVSIDSSVALLNSKGIVNVGDSYLVILRQSSKDIFIVFSLPNLNYLYSSGSIGKGPGEVTSITYGMPIFTRGDTLSIYDANLLRQNNYIIYDTQMKFWKSITIPTSNSGFLINGDLLRLSDSLYVAEITRNNNEFIAISPYQDDILFSFGDYPISKLKGNIRYNEFGKNIVAKPDGSKFISFYFKKDMFKIYNDKGKMLKFVKINDPYLENITRHIQLRASNGKIYVLSYNATADEFDNNLQSLNKPIIAIWNWDGEPIKRIRLSKAIHRFALSEKYQKLYGISVYEQNKLFTIDLTKN